MTQLPVRPDTSWPDRLVARLHAGQDWLHEHRFLVDAAWASFFWALFTLALEGPLPSIVAVFLGGLFALPIALRRRDADAAAAIAVVPHLAQIVLGFGPTFGNVVVLIVMYAVAAYGRRRWSMPWLWFGLAMSLVAGFVWSLQGHFGDPGQLGLRTVAEASLLGGVLGIPTAGLVVAAWLLGALKRSRLSGLQAEADRALAVQREHERSIMLAQSEERQRIAREMHDIVAHSLSVIVVQADGGAYATQMDADPAKRLEVAAQALETIKTTARAALGETRRLVGVLREDGTALELTPSGSLADLPALVQQLTDAGRVAHLRVDGDPASHPPLTPGQELAGFRIVQESLTNVLKHAGPHAAVHVTLNHAPDGLHIAVEDDGVGVSTTPNPGGHGIIGMRERVAAFGGSVSAGPGPLGGFQVVAHLPATNQELP